MKNRFFFLLGIFLLTSGFPTSAQAQFGELLDKLSGGPSPNRLMKEGKFPEALVAHLEKLAEKPDKKRIQKSFGKDYPELMDSIEAQQLRLVTATQAFQGDHTIDKSKELIKHYTTLQKAHDIFDPLGITRISQRKVEVELDIPDVQEKIKASESLLDQHTASAADMHYQQGLFHASHEDKDHQRAAAREFTRALEFIPGYQDAQEKYNKARELGTKSIIILPYTNQSRKNEFGALGNLLSTHLISKLTGDKEVMEFLEVSSESELRQVLQNQGQIYNESISDATASELLKSVDAEVVYFGKVNQVLTPRASTTTSDVKSHTASVKVGTRKVWNDKKNREETENVYGDRTASYQVYTRNFVTTVTGSHSSVDSESPQLSPFKKSFTWSQSWTRKVSGTEEVYKKVQKKASSVPTRGEQVNYIIEQVAQELYLKIKNEVLSTDYPVITRMDQMDTP